MKTLFEYIQKKHIEKSGYSERVEHTKLTEGNFDAVFYDVYKQYIGTKVQFFNDMHFNNQMTGGKRFKYFLTIKTTADNLKTICKNKENSRTMYSIFTDVQLKNAFVDDEYTIIFNFKEFINSFKNDIDIIKLSKELNNKKLFTFSNSTIHGITYFTKDTNPFVILNDLGDLDELLNTINEMICCK